MLHSSLSTVGAAFVTYFGALLGASDVLSFELHGVFAPSFGPMLSMRGLSSSILLPEVREVVF